jgi:transglutaminase-like putative cysteine protease
MKFLRYQLSHRTIYDYTGTVSVSHHLLRLCPRTLPHQYCLRHELKVDPEPAVVESCMDYFGNVRHFVTMEGGHERLSVTSESEVAVTASYVPAPDETPVWTVARGMLMSDQTARGLEAKEFTYASPRVLPDADAAAYAAASFGEGRPLLDAAMDLTARINRDFSFDPTATNVTTSVADVFRERKGVCQDFSHLQIACFRAMGLPARYVSGYLETDPPPGQAKMVGADASHAWVSLFCPGHGWIDLDPTNNCIPSMRHITVGWGRDYGDVSPLRGVVLGEGSHVLTVAVDVTPLGPTNLRPEPSTDRRGRMANAV